MDTSVISVTGRTPLNEVAMLSQKLGPCYLEIKQEGRSQDGGGVGRGEHFLFYKFIERTTER